MRASPTATRSLCGARAFSQSQDEKNRRVKFVRPLSLGPGYRGDYQMLNVSCIGEKCPRGKSKSDLESALGAKHLLDDV